MIPPEPLVNKLTVQPLEAEKKAEQLRWVESYMNEIMNECSLFYSDRDICIYGECSLKPHSFVHIIYVAPMHLI